MRRRLGILMQAAAGGVLMTAYTVRADPLVHLTLFAKNVTAEPTSTYSTFLSVPSAGDVIEYLIVDTVGPVGKSNIHGTITSLTPGTDGINSLRFDIFESPADGLQANFTSPATFYSSDGWTGGNGGTPTDRGNGLNDLVGINPTQGNGQFENNPAFPFGFVASGTFQLQRFSHFTDFNFIRLRWSAGGDGLLRINSGATTIAINAESEFNSPDPIVNYQNLTLWTPYLLPEPSSAALFSIGAIGLLSRRKQRT